MELVIIILLVMVVFELGWIRIRLDKVNQHLARTKTADSDTSKRA